MTGRARVNRMRYLAYWLRRRIQGISPASFQDWKRWAQ